MIKLTDNRTEVYQWDTGVVLDVSGDCTQVHFANWLNGRSIDVEVKDGKATVPDVLLQSSRNLYVWGWVGTPKSGKTIVTKIIKVIARNKPADYVFTPEEQVDLVDIKNYIANLEESIKDLEKSLTPDFISDMATEAIRAYLDTNPIEQVKTDWAENDSTKVSHILNRTHWVDNDGIVHKLDNQFLNLDWLPIKKPGLVEVLPVTRVDNNSSHNHVRVAMDIIVGETYVVNYNGVNYECVAETYPNTNLWLLSGDELPFWIVPVGNPDEKNLFTVTMLDNSPTVDLSIYHKTEVANYITRDFVKDLYYAEETFIDVLPETVLTEKTTVLNFLGLVAGEIYYFNYNGVQYVSTAIASPDGDCIFFDELPFMVQDYPANENYPAECYIELADGVTEGTLSIKKRSEIVHPVDKKYIPELDNVVVKSSTPGSEKRFRITVDDNGTITATEV